MNSLFVDPILFVPRFGLGLAGVHLIEDLQERLPLSVRVAPFCAQQLVPYNGGIHCGAAIVRAPITNGDRKPAVKLPLRFISD